MDAKRGIRGPIKQSLGSPPPPLRLLRRRSVPLSASLTLTSRKIHREKDFSNVYARASRRLPPDELMNGPAALFTSARPAAFIPAVSNHSFAGFAAFGATDAATGRHDAFIPSDATSANERVVLPQR